MTTSNKLTKKELNQVFWRSFGLEWSWNYERQMNMSYCYSMLPVIKKLYTNKEDQAAAMKRHLEFFNTTPQLATLILGISAAMEESNANDPNFDTESINSVKVSLMGPLAGIGDSLIVGTYIPILLGIALGFAEGGSAIGPIFYIVVWNATSIWFQHYIYFLGYNLGGSAVELLVGDRATAFRNAVITMGQVIVGAMAASWVAISTNIVIAQDSTGADITLGSKLDGAFPKLLTCVFVLFCWWLMAKKGMSPVKCLLLMVVIGFVGSVIGLLG